MKPLKTNKLTTMNKAITFIKESYHELRQVSWPTKKQTMNYTIAVIIASLAVAAFLGILDMIFSMGIERYIF